MGISNISKNIILDKNCFIFTVENLKKNDEDRKMYIRDLYVLCIIKNGLKLDFIDFFSNWLNGTTTSRWRWVFHWKFHLYCLCIPKVLSMLHHGSVRPVRSKECCFIFTCTCLECFCCFSSKKLCFYNFKFFLWWSIELPQQNINQSETRIGDKKLSVELSGKMSYHYGWSLKTQRENCKP